MSGRLAALVLILGAILTACSAGAAPSASEPASADAAFGAPSPTMPTPAPPTTAPTTPAPTATSTATPSPSAAPTPTPAPAPPKPGGVDYARCCGEGNTTPESTVRWKTPRTTGVEIRVYGVTACLPTEDGRDDACLRTGTELPADTRVLLAKAPASRGKVTWHQDEPGAESDLCASTMLTRNGTRYYSVVVQAQDALGRSTFAIADPGWYDNEECASYVVQAGDSLPKIAARYHLTVHDLTAANLSTLPDPNRLRVGSTILIPSAFLVGH